MPTIPPSIPHRLDDIDYYGRRIYHITMTTEGRRPLFGTLTGDPALPTGSPGGPAVVPSPLGNEVLACLIAIEHYHRQAHLITWQLMPDHIHFILFITAESTTHLGRIILGFKQGCNKAYRRLAGEPEGRKPAAGEPAVGEPAVGESAIISQTQKQQPPRRPTTEERKHGQLWSTGYHETPLSGRDQLKHMVAYVQDNPRRLLLKRQNATLFRTYPLTAADIPFTAVGNRALVEAPRRMAVRISRRIVAQELAVLLQRYMAHARSGVVLISPFISEGEKAVRDALLAEALPHIRLDGEGFGPYYKPPGRDCDQVACGVLLLLAPWPWQSRARHLGKAEFEALNAMAAKLANMRL